MAPVPLCRRGRATPHTAVAPWGYGGRVVAHLLPPRYPFLFHRKSRIEIRFVHPSFRATAVVVELAIRRPWSSPGRTNAANTSASTFSPSQPEESGWVHLKRRRRLRLLPSPAAALSPFSEPSPLSPPLRAVTVHTLEIRVSFSYL